MELGWTPAPGKLLHLSSEGLSASALPHKENSTPFPLSFPTYIPKEERNRRKKKKKKRNREQSRPIFSISCIIGRNNPRSGEEHDVKAGFTI